MPPVPNISRFTLGEYFLALVDIGLVAYVLYRLFILIRGTRAVQLINGLFILLLATAASRVLRLYTLNWLLEKVVLGASVALPIVFQPELRRALEQIGRGRLIPTKGFLDPGDEDPSRLIDQLSKAVEILARNKTGALMVIERETRLGELIDSGIPIEGHVSWELLTNIFIPNTPLHDGAVILRGSRVMAAACWLPLAEATEFEHRLGSRHRAGVGVTEHSDAVSVIVSEETGEVSVAHGGRLVRGLDEKALRETLTALLRPQPVRVPWRFRPGDG